MNTSKVFWLVAAWLLPLSLAQAYTLKRTDSGSVVRWPSDLEVVTLKVDEALVSFLGPGESAEALHLAASAWAGLSGVPPIEVKFEQPPKYHPEQRGGGVYLLKPWTFEANRLAITVTSYYPNGELVGVDVLVNGEVDYAFFDKVGKPGDRMRHDLAAVLTHEFGHVLGLDENLDDQSATMWPYIRSGETHQRTLSMEDQTALLELYSLPLGEVPPLTCMLSLRSYSDAFGPQWVLCLWPLLFLWVRRIARRVLGGRRVARRGLLVHRFARKGLARCLGATYLRR